MKATKDKLLLFDIDGTLLTSGGAGERSMRLALKDRFGIEDDLTTIEIAGRTDSGIARQLFEKHHIEPSAENLSAFYDAYLHHLATQLPESQGAVLPGILALLEALKANPNIALALLTGNLSSGARLKLTHYGLWHYFEFGAYADDHHLRNELGNFATARAREKHGVEFSPSQMFVLGDTPHDIDCGRAFGARTVAIATGRYRREELAAYQPDFLFDNLADLPGVLSALGL
jgi:phosphoglycolate phosphatase-like HAD superfamily hydrolase